MTVGDHIERVRLAVKKLSKQKLFLGIDWLRFHNPTVDWTESTLVFDRCPSKCGHLPQYLNPEDDIANRKLEEGERIFCFDWESYVGASMDVRVTETKEEAAEPYLKEYPEVFGKKDFDRLPERRPWDHAIELTPGSKPADCKIYPLGPSEQKALDEFLTENLRTGRIRPSKSPMASPFFFVKKKDGALRPVQDY